MATKYIHRQSDVSADAFPNRANAAGLLADSDDNKLKFNSDGPVDEIVDVRHDFSLAGAVTLQQSLLGTTNLAAATQTLAANQSGQIFVGAVDAVFTLRTGLGAGTWYSFVLVLPRPVSDCALPQTRRMISLPLG